MASLAFFFIVVLVCLSLAFKAFSFIAFAVAFATLLSFIACEIAFATMLSNIAFAALLFMVWSMVWDMKGRR